MYATNRFVQDTSVYSEYAQHIRDVCHVNKRQADKYLELYLVAAQDTHLAYEDLTKHGGVRPVVTRQAEDLRLQASGGMTWLRRVEKHGRTTVICLSAGQMCYSE